VVNRLRPGFTLIEVLTVMAALSIVVVLLAVVLGGAVRLQRASAASLDRMGAWHEVVDQFRADVAQTTDAPERWQEEAAGPACLILALGQDRHVVYRWEQGRLLRTESAGGGTHRREVALGDADLEFGRPEADGRLLRLRLFRAGKDGRRQQAAEILAALGGDLQ
jgi:prepilin-type N-terminal cleavage/methylation domain-containing protein